MGTLYFFDSHDEETGAVTLRSDGKPSGKCLLEVFDDHGIPTISIEPESEGASRYAAVFDNLKQFEKFVEAINDLNFRLNPNATGRTGH